MTQKNPSGNLQQGQPFRPVRLRTGELSRQQVPPVPETPREEVPFGRLSMPTKDTFAPQQPFQDNTIDTQDTGQQVALQRSDISTIHTVKHPATPMPAIPATPMPLMSPTPVPQSDLEQGAHIYSHSAKLNAFSPQQQRNASGQIGYSTPQQQGSQSNIPQQQLNNGVQISYAPVQQQFSPPVDTSGNT